jgi:hypothetical protein
MLSQTIEEIDYYRESLMTTFVSYFTGETLDKLLTYYSDQRTKIQNGEITPITFSLSSYAPGHFDACVVYHRYCKRV